MILPSAQHITVRRMRLCHTRLFTYPHPNRRLRLHPDPLFETHGQQLNKVSTFLDHDKLTMYEQVVPRSCVVYEHEQMVKLAAT